MARHAVRRFVRLKTAAKLIAVAIIGALIVFSVYSLYVTVVESRTPTIVEPQSNALQVGRVLSVDSPTSMTVRVTDGDIKVRVIGVADPPQCGVSVSTEFAKTELAGELVTLVPDPSVPRFDPTRQYLYHVVLRSQMSYADAALSSGNVILAGYNSWYRDVYVREESEAQDREDGVWGSPCNLPTNR